LSWLPIADIGFSASDTRTFGARTGIIALRREQYNQIKNELINVNAALLELMATFARVLPKQRTELKQI
jgi:hypothetical protein